MHPMGVKPLKKISRRWGMQGRRCLGTPCWYFGALPPSPSRRRRPTAAPLGWSASAAAAFPCISRSTVLRRGQAGLSFVASFSAAAPLPLAPAPRPCPPPRCPATGRCLRCTVGPRFASPAWNGMGQGEPRRRGPPRPVDVRLRGHGPRPSLATVSPPTQGRLAWSCLRSPSPRGPSPPALDSAATFASICFQDPEVFSGHFWFGLTPTYGVRFFPEVGAPPPSSAGPCFPFRLKKSLVTVLETDTGG
jgi:hypothetical protein